jgi:hypothetical protein
MNAVPPPHSRAWCLKLRPASTPVVPKWSAVGNQSCFRILSNSIGVKLGYQSSCTSQVDSSTVRGSPENVRTEPGGFITCPKFLVVRPIFSNASAFAEQLRKRSMDTALAMVNANTSDNIGVITLNNPLKRNALSTELINDLCAALEEMRQQEVRVVILRAPAGSKVFSSGHDVRELPTNGRDPMTYNDPLARHQDHRAFPCARDCHDRGKCVGRSL